MTDDHVDYVYGTNRYMTGRVRFDSLGRQLFFILQNSYFTVCIPAPKAFTMSGE